MIDYTNQCALVLYDTLKPNSTEIAERLKDLTKFKMHGQIRSKTFETSNITQCLKELSEKGYKWAVVVTPGNFMQTQEVLFRTVDYAMEKNSPLACHILDRGGYYHFHPQWFAINLDVYKEIGFPALEESRGSIVLRTRETERCPENVHDDYTPWWIKPHSEHIVEYGSDYNYFGIKVLSALVEQGYTVVNISQEIRNKKVFCYPDHNTEIIKRLMDGSQEEIQDLGLNWFMKSLRQIQNNLTIGYYVLNTEPMDVGHGYLLQDKKFDCFMGVCGGFKPACITGQDSWANNSKVILFDISPAAIKWQQWLLEKWDGDLSNLENIFREFQHFNPGLTPIYYVDQGFDTNVKWFLDSAKIDGPTLTKRWQKYRRHRHEFVELDLLSDGAEKIIIEHMRDRSQGAYFWASNAFYMDYLMFYKGRTWTIDRTKKFVDTLKRGLDRNSLLEIENTLYACG